jgi:hypothetical protein
MKRMIGFFASKCTGLTPSSTPAWGGACGLAVAEATADEADATIVDMMNRWGVEKAELQLRV